MLLSVRNATRGTILANRARQAKTFGERLLGLMGQRGLATGEALWLDPCNSIHMFFMRFPIDALFLDAGGTVIKRIDALPPWRVTSIYRRARSVLELPAGVAAASHTAEGDRLLIEPPSALL